jgi:hypothetical protein
MKKLNSNPYHRNYQTGQDDRTALRNDRPERPDRLRDNNPSNNNKLNQFVSNTDNYQNRKHNSPDAMRVRPTNNSPTNNYAGTQPKSSYRSGTGLRRGAQ